MNDASVTHVLILAETVVGHRWETILSGPQTKVWLGRAAIPSGNHPDIILVEGCATPVIARDAVGLIRVGGGGPADICLPADCAADELRRTCRLLAEVVSLRREQLESARTQQALAHAAMTDALTGLPNRRAWDSELARRVAETSIGQYLCVAVVDLDRFKQVNDREGHAAGDRLLRTVGRAMHDSVRQGDFVARLGGDEFGLLFWAPGEGDAATIVDRVRRRLAEAAKEAGCSAITASAGFALGKTSLAADSAEVLYVAADMALLAAKQAGRDRTVHHASAIG